jgi:hypothetical protein
MSSSHEHVESSSSVILDNRTTGWGSTSFPSSAHDDNDEDELYQWLDKVKDNVNHDFENASRQANGGSIRQFLHAVISGLDTEKRRTSKLLTGEESNNGSRMHPARQDGQTWLPSGLKPSSNTNTPTSTFSNPGKKNNKKGSLFMTSLKYFRGKKTESPQPSTSNPRF